MKTRHQPVTAESQKRELTSAPGTKGQVDPNLWFQAEPQTEGLRAGVRPQRPCRGCHWTPGTTATALPAGGLPRRPGRTDAGRREVAIVTAILDSSPFSAPHRESGGSAVKLPRPSAGLPCRASQARTRVAWWSMWAAGGHAFSLRPVTVPPEGPSAHPAALPTGPEPAMPHGH